VVDGTTYERTSGPFPRTPLAEAATATIAWWRQRAGATI
jgi:hypothetical protein